MAALGTYMSLGTQKSEAHSLRNRNPLIMPNVLGWSVDHSLISRRVTVSGG
jgi:hypothetical protein